MKDLALNHLALAANCERMANFTYFTEQTRDMHRNRATAPDRQGLAQ